MTSDPSAAGARELSAAQLGAVLRLGTVAVALALAVPLYYALGQFVPPVAAAVPEVLAHAATGAGLFVVFPGTVAYARVLRGRPDGREADSPEYGVDDRWERRNL